MFLIAKPTFVAKRTFGVSQCVLTRVNLVFSRAYRPTRRCLRILAGRFMGLGEPPVVGRQDSEVGTGKAAMFFVRKEPDPTPTPNLTGGVVC